MENSYTSTTTTGYGRRIGNSVKGVLVGILMIVVGTGLLWWNEGRTVKMHSDLAEVGSNVQSVEADTIDAVNEGKLIHINGVVATENGVRDPLFKVADDGLILHRIVEMYQWKETKKTVKKENLGGSETNNTTYTYDKVWDSRVLKSDKYFQDGHENPSKKYHSGKFPARDARLLAFRISQEQLSKILGNKILRPNEAWLERFPEIFENATSDDIYFYSGNLDAWGEMEMR